MHPNLLLVWIAVPAAGPLKPMGYRSWQGNAVTRPYNRQMKEYLNARGVPVFDAYRMTERVISYDGTHMGAAMNLLKSKLLIDTAMRAVDEVGINIAEK